MGIDLRTPTSREIVRITEHKIKLLSPCMGAKCLPRASRFTAKQRILESSTLRTVACKFGNLVPSAKRHLTVEKNMSRYIIELTSEDDVQVGAPYSSLR